MPSLGKANAGKEKTLIIAGCRDLFSMGPRIGDDSSPPAHGSRHLLYLPSCPGSTSSVKVLRLDCHRHSSLTLLQILVHVLPVSL